MHHEPLSFRTNPLLSKEAIERARLNVLQTDIEIMYTRMRDATIPGVSMGGSPVVFIEHHRLARLLAEVGKVAGDVMLMGVGHAHRSKPTHRLEEIK